MEPSTVQIWKMIAKNIQNYSPGIQRVAQHTFFNCKWWLKRFYKGDDINLPFKIKINTDGQYSPYAKHYGTDIFINLESVLRCLSGIKWTKVTIWHNYVWLDICNFPWHY